MTAQEVQKLAEDELAKEGAPKKKGLLIPLLLGVFFAGGAGFGGYWAVSNGLLLGDSSQDSAAGHNDASDEDGASTGAEEGGSMARVALEEVAFVALEPLVINLGNGNAGRHLIFSAELEVAPGDTEAVQHLMPRVLDVLNSYLRLLEMDELTEPRTMVRLRAQMLRRIQIVTGDTLVRDLLVTEFVVN